MDGFAVDFDQLLNELEENEDPDLPRTAAPAQSKQQPQQFLDTSDDLYSSISSPCRLPVDGQPTQPQVLLSEQAAIPQPLYDEPYAPPYDLDLAEADFGPSPPKLSYTVCRTMSKDSSTDSTEGYFVAEDEPPPPCVLNGGGNNGVYDNYNRGDNAPSYHIKHDNKPELIQDAPDEEFRDMLDAEGYVSPSFFSSSPPAGTVPVMSRPDVVPAISTAACLAAGVLNAPCHDHGQPNPAINGTLPDLPDTGVSNAPSNTTPTPQSFNISNGQVPVTSSIPDLAMSDVRSMNFALPQTNSVSTIKSQNETIDSSSTVSHEDTVSNVTDEIPHSKDNSTDFVGSDSVTSNGAMDDANNCSDEEALVDAKDSVMQVDALPSVTSDESIAAKVEEMDTAETERSQPGPDLAEETANSKMDNNSTASLNETENTESSIEQKIPGENSELDQTESVIISTSTDTENAVVEKSEETVEDVSVNPNQTVKDVTVHPEQTVKDVVVHPEQTVKDVAVHPEQTVKDVTVHPEQTVKDVAVRPEQTVKDVAGHPEQTVKDVAVHPKQTVKDVAVHPEQTVKDVVVHPEQTVKDDNVSVQSSIVEATDVPTKIISNQSLASQVQNVEVAEMPEPVTPKDPIAKLDFKTMTPEMLTNFEIDAYVSDIPTDEISQDVESEISRLEAEISMMKGELKSPIVLTEEHRTSPDGTSQQDDSGVKISELGFHAVSPAVKLQADGDPGEIQKDPESAATLSDTDSTLEMMVGDERRDSDGSVEKFLIPSMPVHIATPIEDAGFSKVPGFIPELDSMREEDEPVTTPVTPEQNMVIEGTIPDPSGEDVRPKDSPPTTSTASTPGGRISRPNSLIGLSMPEMPLPSPKSKMDSGVHSLDSDINALAVSSPTQPQSPAMHTEPELKNEEVIKAVRPRMSLNLPSPMTATAPPGQLSGGQANAMNSPMVGELSPFAAPSPVSITSRPQLASGIGLPPHLEGAMVQPPSPAIAQPAISSAHYPPQDPPAYTATAPAAAAASAASSMAYPPNAVVTPNAGPTLRRPNSLDIQSQQAFQPAEEEEEMSEDGASEGRRLHNASLAEPPSPLPICPRGPHQTTPPLSTSDPRLSITELGKVAPHWIPDADASNCMQCDVRFTFTRRRHHCRACGKVFCNACCNLRAKLVYMDDKEARVCSKCYQDLIRAQVYERMHTSEEAARVAAGAEGSEQSTPSPNPNNPSEYCSTLPPQQQVDPSALPPVVMVPTGVLRKDGVQRRPAESKSVMFSDGIRPGGDLTELDGSAAATRSIPPASQRSSRRQRRGRNAAEVARANAMTNAPTTTTSRSDDASRYASLIPTDGGLPPLILERGGVNEDTLEQNPDMQGVLEKLQASSDTSMLFAVNRNLAVHVKILDLDCCIGCRCWSFSSEGMCTVGQDEMAIVLQCQETETAFPIDILRHMQNVYTDAGQGNRVGHMGHTLFTPQDGAGFLDSKDHAGFLYIRPSFQCLQKLLLPSSPYVFGILLQKWETPWVKVFPLRLLLRLGAEFRYYPCPLVSVRFRRPVYQEIGHTIINLLADLRNFQYSISHVRGATIHMESGNTTINLPRNRYNDVMKVISNSNEHVMSFSSNFSNEADSHLVCIQNEEGNYQTQAINIQNKPRKTTGASFVVFNGALKTSSGLRGKSSIVEDGLMVQVSVDVLGEIKQALRDMLDYTVSCGPVTPPGQNNSTQPQAAEETVTLTWVDDDKNFNIGIRSPIDDFPLDGVESVNLHNAADYVGGASRRRSLRWTAVYFLAANANEMNARVEPVDTSRLAETLATAASVALTPHLDTLKEAKCTLIGLRVNISSENVGYQVGSRGEKLSSSYMSDLDNELIPVIHNAAASSQSSDGGGAVTLELVFHIVE